jgi:hypothetical protein
MPNWIHKLIVLSDLGEGGGVEQQRWLSAVD